MTATEKKALQELKKGFKSRIDRLTKAVAEIKAVINEAETDNDCLTLHYVEKEIPDYIDFAARKAYKAATNGDLTSEGFDALANWAHEIFPDISTFEYLAFWNNNNQSTASEYTHSS